MKKDTTSWEGVKNWYDGLVGENGHYFHQKIILPGVKRLLNLQSNSSLLDLGCGQGILSRVIPKEVDYLGIDISPSLIQEAKKYRPDNFFVGDISHMPPLSKQDFTHSCFILSLQNMKDPQKAIAFAANHLGDRSHILLILNHPCFRIPRQTSWGEEGGLYRKVNRYMSPLQIPIRERPGREKSAITYSFHHCLSDISSWLFTNGFVITQLEEWCSDKTSTGKRAKMENFVRKEFPLFLAIGGKKKYS